MFIVVLLLVAITAAQDCVRLIEGVPHPGYDWSSSSCYTIMIPPDKVNATIHIHVLRTCSSGDAGFIMTIKYRDAYTYSGRLAIPLAEPGVLYTFEIMDRDNYWEHNVSYCLDAPCNSSCLTDCNLHGGCIGNSTCDCDARWGGVTCSDKIPLSWDKMLLIALVAIGLLMCAGCSVTVGSVWYRRITYTQREEGLPLNRII
jgi:hypothetical protein